MLIKVPCLKTLLKKRKITFFSKITYLFYKALNSKIVIPKWVVLNKILYKIRFIIIKLRFLWAINNHRNNNFNMNISNLKLLK